MENDFGLILLTLVKANKEKFLGLLRRNGVIVESSVSADFLTSLILRAMQKSETFKKEVVLFMSVLLSKDDSSFSNFTNPFKGSNPLDDFNFSTSFPSSPSSGTSTSTISTSEKKKFEDTTVGQIADKLLGFANVFINKKDLDVREKEAQAGVKISQDKVLLETVKEDEKPKSNVGLYVGLGVGGLVVVGLLVYLISKKK
jgi:hypothetical protein